MKSVGIIGLGYVGLPLAIQSAQKGYKVIGYDIDSLIVKNINERINPFVNDERFSNAFVSVSSSLFHATSELSELSNVDVVVICVPTPTANKIPDLTIVEDAARSVATILKTGQLILLESTVSPGVTRRIVLDILESSTGLKVGRDFNLAYCPERIDPGNQKLYVGNLNRVVGGITKDCSQKAIEFYSSIIDAEIVKLDSTEEAEFVKSWENSHRNVMIALANSAAIICDAVGMNIDNVLRGLQSKVDQFGLSLAKPGIGPGGHCIPEDIHFVIKNAREYGVDTKFLDDASEVNDKMPYYAVDQLSEMVNKNDEKLKNLNVLLLGLAYKPNVNDLRRSPAVEMGYILSREAKKLFVHDQYVKLNSSIVPGAEIVTDLKSILKDVDIVVIGCAHDEYLVKGLITKSNSKVRYIYDGRNCLDAEAIKKEDILYKGVGK